MKVITQEQFDELAENIWHEYLAEASQEDLFQSVISANWDSNSTLLNWILVHPEVDQATILMAYWKGTPLWNKQFKDRDELIEKQGWGIESFDFTEQVEIQFVNHFWKNQNIFYDPKDDHIHGENWTLEYAEYPQVREIPEQMYEMLKGQYIERA